MSNLRPEVLTYDLTTARGRLEYAVVVLRSVHAEARSFDIRYWLTDDTNGCGMTACAGGWLAMDPAFRNIGLKLYVFGGPVFQHVSGFSAMAKLLGISLKISKHFFSHHAYDVDLYPQEITALDVADRIESYLQDTAS